MSHCTIRNKNDKNAFQSKATRPLVLTLTLVLKLDLDMVLIYNCAKKNVSIPSISKVTVRTDTQTDTQTRKNITSLHTLAVKFPFI